MPAQQPLWPLPTANTPAGEVIGSDGPCRLASVHKGELGQAQPVHGSALFRTPLGFPLLSRAGQQEWPPFSSPAGGGDEAGPTGKASSAEAAASRSRRREKLRPFSDPSSPQLLSLTLSFRFAEHAARHSWEGKT